MQDAARASNRLADATSPYLLQHAHNPVDWWPWCEEALARARTLDRPVLLSIGYSACHWCHVMAHESFEDPQTAELMNRFFVNVKVDREERPDLDKIYQAAHQVLARRAGGWPLTLFLTPEDQTPFFAGTYFPKEPRHGLPSFSQLLGTVARAYREQGDAIRAQNASLMQVLEGIDAGGGGIPDVASLNAARDQLARGFDAHRGGFGPAPKFPHPTSLDLLLRVYGVSVERGDPDEDARHMATWTLEQMILGGINDQLGGGFCRYSVDADWMIPHFEKMLYDNGPLLALCCDAWQLTGDLLFRRAAEATAAWAMREMQSPQGGYYASLDADSEGREGCFYVWDRVEIKGLLGGDEWEVFAAVYGLEGEPNFEGRWHLHTFLRPEQLARSSGRDAQEVERLLASARVKLLERRGLRPRPGRDEKVLTAWNGLMIKGMARAARVLGRGDCLASAEAALDFVRSSLWRDGRLLAVCTEGSAHLNAYLDDYANLLDALLELLQVRWRREDLAWGVDLADVLLERFLDRGAGGFFFTSDDHERLIHRPKPLADESVPAGNGVAAQALQRLGHLLGDTRYLEAARGALAFAGGHVRRSPIAHASLLAALDEHLDPPETIIIRGDARRIGSWRARAQAGYSPRRLVIAIPADEPHLPGGLDAMRAGEGVLAYRCRGTRCEAPVTDLEALGL
jgi:uncharacterized protein YyaL (SSP411 family)